MRLSPPSRNPHIWSFLFSVQRVWALLFWLMWFETLAEMAHSYKHSVQAHLNVSFKSPLRVSNTHCDVVIIPAITTADNVLLHERKKHVCDTNGETTAMSLSYSFSLCCVVFSFYSPLTFSTARETKRMGEGFLQKPPDSMSVLFCALMGICCDSFCCCVLLLFFSSLSISDTADLWKGRPVR